MKYMKFIVLSVVVGLALSSGGVAYAERGEGEGWWRHRDSERGWSYGRMWQGSAGYDGYDDLVRRLQERIDELENRSDRYYRSYASYQANYDDAEVTTCPVYDIEDDRATLCGRLDLGSARYARVWFEYGKNSSSLPNSTSPLRMEDGDHEFEARVGLSEDTDYYVRAVAEFPNGTREYGSVRQFATDRYASSWGEEPEVRTREVDRVNDDSARVSGDVDMNDGRDGTVFVVYGTDKGRVSGVADDYDTYDDIDENGEKLQKVRVDENVGRGDSDTYTIELYNLDYDTTYYVAFGVSYEDEDGDERIERGSLRSFTTDY